MIADELVVVTITHEGYVKRMPIDIYKVQGRGGRGLTAANLRRGLYSIYLCSLYSFIYPILYGFR